MKSLGFKYPQIIFICLLLVITSAVSAQNKYTSKSQTVTTKQLGKDTIYSNSSVYENLSKTAEFSIYARILKLIDFESLIKTEEMVTVFVVPNSAFSQLTEEELEAFLAESNRENLKNSINYFIIPGRVDEHSIVKAVSKGNGTANFRALDHKTVQFKSEGNKIYLIADGIKASMLQSNFKHSKGFFHVVKKLPIKLKGN